MDGGDDSWWRVFSTGSRLGPLPLQWLNRLSGCVIGGFGFWNLSKLAFQ